MAVFLRLGDSMLRDLLPRIEGLTDAVETLDALIENHVEALWDNREAFPLLYQEDRNLSLAELREAQHRRRFWYDLWALSLHEVRPELSLHDCETMAQATLWLIQSVAFYEGDNDPGRAK